MVVTGASPGGGLTGALVDAHYVTLCVAHVIGGGDESAGEGYFFGGAVALGCYFLDMVFWILVSWMAVW